MVPGVRRRKIPQQKYQKKDSTQKAQTENYEQIKYEIAGENEGPKKHKTKEVYERD